MIALLECLLGCATLVSLAGLVVAKSVFDRPAPLRREQIDEKRRVLEHDRAEWVAVIRSSDRPVQNKLYASQQMKRIDRELLALAEVPILDETGDDPA